MKDDNIFFDGLSGILIFCAMYFIMKALIKAELKVNPNKKDGFLFRLRAAKAPILVLFGFIFAIYTVPLLAYILVPNSSNGLRVALRDINTRILFLLVVTLPPIIYNLISYKKSWENKI